MSARGMHVETRDWRPGSMLYGRALTPAARLAGLTTGALGLAFLTVFILADLGGTVDALLRGDEAEEAEALEEPEIIEAAFVQLGREFRPRELPDRQVATSSLAPRLPDPNVVSKRTVTPEPRPEQPPAPNSYEDMLSQLGNTSRFVDSNVAAETEGDPNGNEEGRFSQDGSAYLGTLVGIVKRGWQVPVTIPDSELVGLRAVVSFRITDDLRMEDLRISRRSGNADYDRSIEQRLEEIRQSLFRLPPPPPEERARFIGPAINFNRLPPEGLRGEARARLDRAGASASEPAASEEAPAEGTPEPSGSAPEPAEGTPEPTPRRPRCRPTSSSRSGPSRPTSTHPSG
jgi:hypothetical protein